MLKSFLKLIRLDDWKSLKWKNLKLKEKKFLIVTFIILFILIFAWGFGYYSNYARIMKYPKEFNEYILFKIDGLKIYYPNKVMRYALTLTPKATKIANTQYYIFKGIMAFIWVIFALPIKYKKEDDTYGTARWGTFDDLGLRGFFLPSLYAKAFEVNLLEETGVVLGEVDGRIIRDNGKTHILLSAPTRTGKGVSIIIPTLVDSWKDSVLVLDIKGENYQMTAGWRQKEFKNKILKFSPKQKGSCKFNPLLEIRYMTDKEIEDTKVISELIVIDEGSSDPFWGIAGSDFCSAVIMYVLHKNRGKGSLSDVVKFITDPSAPLDQRIEEIIKKPLFDKNNKEDKEIMDKLKEIYTSTDERKLIDKGFHPFVSNGMADTLSKGEKTMGSIVATAKAKLSVFESPTVAENTRESDFRIMDLMAKEQAHSLYVVIEPGDLTTLAPLLRILIIQCVTLLTPEMDYTGNNKNAVKFKNRLLMLLDEFPSIGKMEVLEKAIGYVAGYGMKMMIVVQSLDQLNKIYTKDNMFLSNCQTQVFYTANENQTAEYISKTIGTKTVSVKTYSTNGAGGIFASRNYSYNKMARELLKPEEVRRFPLDKILLLVGGKPPIQTNKVLFFTDKRFKDKVKKPIDTRNLTDALKSEMEIMEKSNKNIFRK